MPTISMKNTMRTQFTFFIMFILCKIKKWRYIMEFFMEIFYYDAFYRLLVAPQMKKMKPLFQNVLLLPSKVTISLDKPFFLSFRHYNGHFRRRFPFPLAASGGKDAFFCGTCPRWRGFYAALFPSAARHL